MENQYEDLSSVIEYLLNKSYEKIILFANSFASVSCLKNYRPEILTMILTGAVTDSVKYKCHEFFSLDQLEDLNKNGYFKMKNKREHLIVKQTLKDFEEIDQVKLLKNVKCPVLIIHGNNKDDLEEIELLSHSRRAIKKLPEASELEVIEGGRHGLHDHWDQVIEMTLQWTRKYKE